MRDSNIMDISRMFSAKRLIYFVPLGDFLGVEDGVGGGLGCLCARASSAIVLKMVLILVL